jgi:hypothetical protein
LVLSRESDARASHPAVNSEDRGFERQVVDSRKDCVAAANRIVQIRDSARIA